MQGGPILTVDEILRVTVLLQGGTYEFSFGVGFSKKSLLDKSLYLHGTEDSFN